MGSSAFSRFCDRLTAAARSARYKVQSHSIQAFGGADAIGRHLATIARLRRKLDPLAAARRDAAQMVPPPDATARGEFEHGVHVAFQRELDGLKEATAHRLKAIEAEARRANAIQRPDFSREREALEEDLDRTMRERRDALVEARAVELKEKRLLNAFRAVNGLQREVEPGQGWIAWLGVATILLLEAFFNFNYLVVAGVDTPINTVVLVLATAAINVFFGLSLGYFGARHLTHVRWSRKVSGMAVIAAAGAGILVLNGILGRYRTLIETLNLEAVDAAGKLRLLDDVRLRAVAGLLDSPLSFAASMQGLIVFFLGVMFAAVAAYEGYRLLDDPYPGYGVRARRYATKRAVAEAAWTAFEAECLRLQDRRIAGIGARAAEVSGGYKTVKSAVDDAKNAMAAYERAASTVQQALLQIVEAYRKENAKIREAAPPGYWQFDHPTLDRDVAFDVADLEGWEDRAGAEAQAVDAEAEVAKRALMATRQDIVQRLREYVASVDSAAAERDAAFVRLMGPGHITNAPSSEAAARA